MAASKSDLDIMAFISEISPRIATLIFFRRRGTKYALTTSPEIIPEDIEIADASSVAIGAVISNWPSIPLIGAFAS